MSGSMFTISNFIAADSGFEMFVVCFQNFDKLHEQTKYWKITN